jgi:hypothetical protein
MARPHVIQVPRGGEFADDKQAGERATGGTMSGLAGSTTTAPARARSERRALGTYPWRRVAGLAAVVAGIAIAVSPFAFSLAGNAAGGERVTDRFRATLSTQGLHNLQGGFNTVAAMGGEFFGRVLPDTRRALHQSPAQFQAGLNRRFPAIAEAQREVPPVVALVQPRIPVLVGLDDDFKKVDSLPFLGLPISSVPWILLGLGIGVAGLGVLVVARPTRAGAALVAVAGLGLVVVPLAVSAPDKADAAVNLDRAGQFVFSPKIAPVALATAGRVDRLIAEVETKFIPQAAATLHESPAALKAQIARRYPAVGRGLAAWPSIRPTAYDLPRKQIASERDFANLDGIDFRAMPWTVIAPGVLMLLLGGAALVLSRPEDRLT